MGALVVYESMFGNTRAVAAAVTDGLMPRMPVRLPASIRAAAFDTRINRPRLPGSAASAAARRLRRLGAHIVGDPESFYVRGKEGPLVAGELERARLWGEVLALEVGSVRTP